MTLIVEKKYLNCISVAHVSIHDEGTFVNIVEPYLIGLNSVRLEIPISVFANISQAHLVY